jgi:hypothetical protein
VRWVIHHSVMFEAGNLQTKCKLFAIGHHIAMDGFSLSILSREILQRLDVQTQHPVAEQSGLSYGEYVQRQVNRIVCLISSPLTQPRTHTYAA